MVTEKELLEAEVVEEKKTARRTPKKEVRKLCKLVGTSVSVYRTESEMKKQGGEWEIIE